MSNDNVVDFRKSPKENQEKKAPARADLLQLLRNMVESSQGIAEIIMRQKDLSPEENQALAGFSAVMAGIEANIGNWANEPPPPSQAWVVLDGRGLSMPEIAIDREAAIRYAKTRACHRGGGAALVTERQVGNVIDVQANGLVQFSITPQPLIK